MLTNGSIIRLYSFLLAIGLLTGCQTWELPTRLSQRQCTPPNGQLGSSANQLNATLSVAQPTGTVHRIDWDFGNGKTQSTTEMSVAHLYASRGTYTVKATLTNLCGDATVLTRSVTVTDVLPPTVSIQDATNITKTTATLRLAITDNGKGTISEYGVYYSKTNQQPDAQDPKVTAKASLSVGTVAQLPVTGLEPGVTYYVRAYARNEANPEPAAPSRSTEVRQFRLLIDPQFTLSGTPAVNRTNATVNFTITNPGNPVATHYGIVYSADINEPTTANAVVNVTSPAQGSNVPVGLTNLTLDRTYYYRPFARMLDGSIVYGPTGTFSTVDITTDLIVDVPFTNRSLLDQTANSNNANTVGGPAFTTDRKGAANSAILLNGSSQYFYFIDNAGLRPAALTVSLWIKLSSLNGRVTLYNKSRFSDSYGEQYSSLIKPNETGPGITINTDIKQGSNCTTGGWQTFPLTSAIPILNTWRHLVFTYEGRTARMYLDGLLLSERTDLPGTSMDNCAGGDLKFGAQIREYPQWFDGVIDDVRVYRRSLTSAQVQALKAL